MSKVKHYYSIMKAYSPLFTETMSENEKITEINRILSKSGKSFQDASDDFEAGIKNGYSVETQIEIVNALARVVNCLK